MHASTHILSIPLRGSFDLVFQASSLSLFHVTPSCLTSSIVSNKDTIEA